jgi:hypothetical protein
MCCPTGLQSSALTKAFIIRGNCIKEAVINPDVYDNSGPEALIIAHNITAICAQGLKVFESSRCGLLRKYIICANQVPHQMYPCQSFANTEKQMAWQWFAQISSFVFSSRN